MFMIQKEWKEFYRSSLCLITMGLIILSAWFVFFQFKGMGTAISFRSGLISVFQVSLYFLPLIALIYGAFSMNIEKNQQTLSILMVRGMSISKFVWTKFYSIFSVFLPTILFAYFLAMIPAKFVFGSIAMKEFSFFVLSMVLLSMIFVSIGLFIGAWFNEKVKVIGASLVVWLGLIYLFDLILMYWLPYVSLNNVLAFSLVYFLSPVHTIQYFLSVQLSIYELSNMSAMYEQVTFQSPWLVLIVNFVLWIGITIAGSMAVLQRKGASHD